MVRILFIDDDPEAHAILRFVVPDGCRIVSALSGRAGCTLAREENPDLVLLDIGLPDCDGMEVLQEIAALPAAPPVVMLTAYDEPEDIVRAVKAGAYDYLVKPINRGRIARAVDTAIRIRLHRATHRSDGDREILSEIVGESLVIEEVRRRIESYARSNAMVLITGESGTGKELAAHSIHRLSARKEGQFVPINCGAIPETLAETELFGSEKGAYTDATSRPGIFERANGGTLFLDEIGELSQRAQVTLLRIIEAKEVSRVGSTRQLPLDVRILAATNRDLREEVTAGRFRLDLFYRIDILRLPLPPLRERSEDLALLVDHFLRSQDSPKRLSLDALEKLCCYAWPGNIRELRNVIERATLLAEGDLIEPLHLSFA